MTDTEHTDNERITERHPYECRWYLNGFPKSGLHLVAAMLMPVAGPMPPETVWRKPWAGTFAGNSWTEEKVSSEKALYRISRLADGKFLKSHTGYRDEIERFLYYLGVAHVFIYRDPRDVAVSQTYHILSQEGQKLVHPEKELYRSLGSFEAILEAVIVGLNQYPGVMQRWQHYAPWLDMDWVHKVRFEDARRNPHEVAEGILRYGLQRVAQICERKLVVVEPALQMVVEAMVARAECKEYSPTYRKGEVGSWRHEFTNQHKQLFKETDTDGWLVRLGYEESNDW